MSNPEQKASGVGRRELGTGINRKIEQKIKIEEQVFIRENSLIRELSFYCFLLLSVAPLLSVLSFL
jgi:hypothetical protein